jgi:hypothetical protein
MALAASERNRMELRALVKKCLAYFPGHAYAEALSAIKSGPKEVAL